jgi:hypothetical protein
MIENLIISATKDTPGVSFKNTGDIKLKGRSFPEDPIAFYEPLIKWATLFAADSLNIDIKLEYFNTSTSKQLLILLQTFCKKEEIKNIDINWYYEEGDQDGLEAGEHYAGLISKEINFIPYPERMRDADI